MGFKTVIFDMDGTILDTLQDIHASVNVTLRHFGWSERSMEEVRKAVGNGAAKLIDRVIPEGSSAETSQMALAFYKSYYDRHAEEKTGPYPGIPKLIDDLLGRGIQVAVVSNKPDESVVRLCDRYFPGKLSVAIGDRAEFRTKPAPDSTWEAMRILSAEPESTVYIGDSDVDIKTAQNAGVACISVSWGFRDREFLLKNGATNLVDNTEELLTAIVK